MEIDELIGKEFTCFEFNSDRHLSYTSQYKSYEGCTAVVKNIHSTFKQYANSIVTDNDGRTSQMHYPTQMIIDQLKEKENKSVDDILMEMKHLISRI